MSVNSTSNLEGAQKYPKPQINKDQLSKKGLFNKQSYIKKPDKIYHHHFNKKQEAKDQIKNHHLPQLQQIKQPQQMNQPYETKDQLIEETQSTHINQEVEDGSENEKENNEQGGTRHSYYPDPKPNYYSLSRYPFDVYPGSRLGQSSTY